MSNRDNPYCDPPLPKDSEQKEVLQHISNETFQIKCYINGQTSYSWAINKVFDNGCTLLSWAIRKGKDCYISDIIKYYGGLNKKEDNGGTPLTIATYLNSINIVKLLLRYYGLQINDKDVDGYSALSIAVREAHLDIFNCLLERGADIKLIKEQSLYFSLQATNENKIKMLDTLLDKGLPVALYPYFLVAVARTGHLDAFQKVLKLKVNVNDLIDGKTPLAWAAEEGHLDLIKILITNGSEINKLCSDGNTPLAIAAKHKRLNVVKYLSRISNISKVGPNGKTALHWAVHNEDFDMVKFLVSDGADCLVDDVILDAIEKKHLKIVQVLVEAGAIICRKNKISEDNNGMTPLKKSLEVGSIEIARYLLENGANIEDDLEGDEISFVVKFLECNNFDMIQLIVEKGAQVNVFNGNGQTLLTKSIQIGNFAMLKCFVEHGANVNQIDKNGLSPIAAAASNGDMRAFKFLVDHGATIGDKEKANPQVSKYYQLIQQKSLNQGTVTVFAAVVGDNKMTTQKVVTTQQKNQSSEKFSMSASMVSKDEIMNVLNKWRETQIEKIQKELKLLHVVEDMMGNYDSENREGYSNQTQFETILKKIIEENNFKI